MLAHHTPNRLTREISQTNHLKPKILKNILKLSGSAAHPSLGRRGEGLGCVSLSARGEGGWWKDSVAVFDLVSHLTAGLASGNRKYDITALTFWNVGMSGCLFTPLEPNTAGRMDTRDNRLQLRYSKNKD